MIRLRNAASADDTYYGAGEQILVIFRTGLSPAMDYVLDPDFFVLQRVEVVIVPSCPLEIVCVLCS